MKPTLEQRLRRIEERVSKKKSVNESLSDSELSIKAVNLKFRLKFRELLEKTLKEYEDWDAGEPTDSHFEAEIAISIRTVFNRMAFHSGNKLQ